MLIDAAWRHAMPKNMFAHSVQKSTSLTDAFQRRWQHNLTRYFLICTIPPNWGVQKLLSPSVLKLVKFCLGKSFLLLKGVISQEI